MPKIINFEKKLFQKHLQDCFEMMSKPRDNEEDPMGNYSIENFTQDEFELATKFIEKAIIAFVTVSAEQKAVGVLNQLKKMTFNGDDEFKITFEIKTMGNDLITALSAARIEKSGAKGACRFCGQLVLFDEMKDNCPKCGKSFRVE